MAQPQQQQSLPSKETIEKQKAQAQDRRNG